MCICLLRIIGAQADNGTKEDMTGILGIHGYQYLVEHDTVSIYQYTVYMPVRTLVLTSAIHKAG